MPSSRLQPARLLPSFHTKGTNELVAMVPRDRAREFQPDFPAPVVLAVAIYEAGIAVEQVFAPKTEVLDWDAIRFREDDAAILPVAKPDHLVHPEKVEDVLGRVPLQLVQVLSMATEFDEATLVSHQILGLGPRAHQARQRDPLVHPHVLAG